LVLKELNSPVDYYTVGHGMSFISKIRSPSSKAPQPPCWGFFFGAQQLVDSRHAGIDSVLNMAPNDQKTEVALPAEVPEDLPPPSDPKAIFLGGLFILAVLAVAYVASDIVLPLVFAIVLKLLLQPALRILAGLHVPRTIASLLLILVLFGTIVGLGTAISGPARTWAAKLPEGIPRLEERLSFMRAPINHCRGSCSRWKIWEQRDHPRMQPPRR
jgi:AI-2E family transporter